jgi:hypothetical protein
MNNKYTEIQTLESSSSPRRSKSVNSSQNFYSPKVNTQYYLIDRREPEEYDMKISERQEEDTVNVSNIKSETHNKSTKNKFTSFEETPYQYLENKFNNLKEKYNIIKKEAVHWRSSYFNLLKDSLVFDETIKTLYEENRIHLEYIISLENKLNKLLDSCNNITNNFHQNICKSINMGEINIQTNSSVTSNTSINNAYIKNFNEVLNDYKKQLEILADEKDNLNTNLSISRHQQLQYSLRLEELQDRLYRVEQARHEELKISQSSQPLQAY